MFFGHCHRTRFRGSFCLASVFEMTVYLLTYLLTFLLTYFLAYLLTHLLTYHPVIAVLFYCFGQNVCQNRMCVFMYCLD